MTVQDRVQLISDNTNLSLDTKITTAKIEISFLLPKRNDSKK